MDYRTRTILDMPKCAYLPSLFFYKANFAKFDKFCKVLSFLEYDEQVVPFFKQINAGKIPQTIEAKKNLQGVDVVATLSYTHETGIVVKYDQYLRQVKPTSKQYTLFPLSEVRDKNEHKFLEIVEFERPGSKKVITTDRYTFTDNGKTIEEGIKKYTLTPPTDIEEEKE